MRYWANYGHRRLYVKTAGGAEVGHFDLKTGREHIAMPGLGTEFRAAVEQWRREHAGEQRPAATSARPPRPRRPAEAVGGGLADRRAGDGVAAIAAARRPQSRTVRGLARLFGVRTADQAWKVGAEGEVYVGRRLDRLRRGSARVLHSVPLGAGGDIDHLVISTYGVWVVNTKHHRGKVITVKGREIRVGSRPTSYAEASAREAARVRSAFSAAGLHVNVSPIIVVHGARQIRGSWTHRPAGVRVLSSSSVPWWWRWKIGRPRLSEAMVAALYAAADDPATWAGI